MGDVISIAEQLSVPPEEDGNELLRIRGVSKRFGAVQALRNMSFDLRKGEVQVLFGENGAGKSTLISIIAGALAPDEGVIELSGADIHFSDVRDARAHGIAAMFQEFSLAPHLSVEENIFLGAEPRNGIVLKIGERRRRAREALERFGFDLNPMAIVATLSRAQQQMVEMTKALLTNPNILILDEPTASLSERETELLFELIRGLKAKGVGIIYITHRLSEIRAIGDQVTVLRDGQFVANVKASDVSDQALVELMTGRSIEQFYPKVTWAPGPCLLKLEDLVTDDNAVRGVSIELRAGEIVGLAGLVGCGKSEIGRAVFGLSPIVSGSITAFDQIERRPTPKRMLERGVTYITSDRRNEGLMMLRCTQENLTLASLETPEISKFHWLGSRKERAFARAAGQQMRLSPLDLDKKVVEYSGGNQQKILIGKALARGAKVFIFDEPTVGIDVGTRVEVYGLIKEHVEKGGAALIISSDLPEALNLSHRLYVIREGRVVDHGTRAEMTEARVLHGFFGTRDAAH